MRMTELEKLKMSVMQQKSQLLLVASNLGSLSPDRPLIKLYSCGTQLPHLEEGEIGSVVCLSTGTL